MENNLQNRINELITELSECREDERNSQNQILTIISTVGTVLGILFGTSYLSADKQNTVFDSLSHPPVFKNVWINRMVALVAQNVTNTRITFWLSLLIFCTAFSYITVLGIGNLLRYYYIQSIEDRLFELIRDSPDNNGRGSFLHWGAYSAPIITRNTKHITSSHTALNYICYTIATGDS